MASSFQTKIINMYKKNGYTVLKIIRLNENGYPDLVCLKEGKIKWIECKEVNDILNPLQKMRIDELRNNGFEAIVMQDTKGIIY